MSPSVIGGIDCICVVLLIDAIFKSSRRLASLGYAVLAFGLGIVLGVIAMFILVPSGASVTDTNSALDTIGGAISIGAFVAAVWAANTTPHRVKA